MLDVFGVSVVAEVAVHLDLHQEVPDGGGGELEGPAEDPHGAGYEEEEVPEPEKSKYLDDISSIHYCSNTQCVGTLSLMMLSERIQMAFLLD